MVRYANLANGKKEGTTSQQKESPSDSIYFSKLEGLGQAVNHGAEIFSDVSIEEEKTIVEKVQKKYSVACDYLQYIKNRVIGSQSFNIDAGPAIIKNFLALPDFRYLLSLISNYTDNESYHLCHPINTMIYALMIGQSMGYTEEKLVELGMAALFHDIGMFKIPDPILNKPGELNEEELDLIKKHPEMGKELLQPFEENNKWLNFLEAVYQHHEWESGRGYHGLKGAEINEYAKIVGICDCFEAMTHNRPHKKGIIQSAAVRELIGTKKDQFSTKTIKSFLDAISLYPVGSYVRLNNNSIGVVLAFNKAEPLKPMVKLIRDIHGGKVSEEKVINLAANPILHIVEGISEAEINI